MRYILGCWRAGGLWRHQQWSPSWILPRIRNQAKTRRNGNFGALHETKYINKHFAWFYPQDTLLLLKEVKKTRIFTQNWLDQEVSYFVYVRSIVLVCWITCMKRVTASVTWSLWRGFISGGRDWMSLLLTGFTYVMFVLPWVGTLQGHHYLPFEMAC